MWNFINKKQILYLFFILIIFFWSPKDGYMLSQYSFRMQGLGISLIDFMDDEYSSIFYNPALINKSKKTRLFSNLNNLHSGLNKDRIMDQRNVGDFSLLPYPLYDDGGWLKISDFDLPVNLVGMMAPVLGYNTLFLIEYGGFSGNLEIAQEEENQPAGARIENKNSFNINGSFYMYGVTLARGIGNTCGIILAYENWAFDGIFQEDDHYKSFDAGGNLVSESRSIDTYNGDFDKKSIDFKLGFFSDSGGGDRNDIIFYGEPLFVSLTGSIIDHDEYLPWAGAGSMNENDDGSGDIIKGSGYTFGAKMRFRNKLGSGSAIRKFFGGNRVHWNWVIGLNYSYIPMEISSTNYNYNFSRLSPIETISSETIERSEGEGSGHLFNGSVAMGGEIDISGSALIIFGFKLNLYYLAASIGFREPEEKTTYRHFIDDLNPLNDEAYVTRNYSSGKEEYSGSGFAAMLDIPVGVEVQLFKGFFLRLGASSIMPLFLIGQVRGTSDNKWRSETSYTEGTNAGTTIFSEGSPRNVDSSYDAHLLASMVTYTFGAGFQVTDSISIDLLHFANLIDLSTWMLSVSIGFGGGNEPRPEAQEAPQSEPQPQEALQSEPQPEEKVNVPQPEEAQAQEALQSEPQPEAEEKVNVPQSEEAQSVPQEALR